MKLLITTLACFFGIIAAASAASSRRFECSNVADENETMEMTIRSGQTSIGIVQKTSAVPTLSGTLAFEGFQQGAMLFSGTLHPNSRSKRLVEARLDFSTTLLQLKPGSGIVELNDVKFRCAEQN